MGYSAGFLANETLWFIGLIVGTFRLVTPFMPDGRKGVWSEILIAGSFILYIASFVFWYPMRHAQYLIPIAVFIAYYAADAIVWVWKRLIYHRWSTLIFLLTYAVGLVYLYGIFFSVNTPKLSFTDTANVPELSKALATIPKNAYVLDLVGTTIYFRDPYYVSGVPFGQWEPFLSRPLPSLSDALERTKTRYIFQGGLGRVSALSQDDQTYIAAHYTGDQNAQMLIRDN